MKKDTDQKAKFRMLERRLNLPYWQIRGLLDSIWHFTSLNARRGNIGRYSNQEIADAIGFEPISDGRLKPLIFDEVIDELVHCGWLDPHPDPAVRLLVHDWHEHCEQWVKKQLSRAAETFYKSVRTCPATSQTCPPGAARLGYARHTTQNSIQDSETPFNLAADSPPQAKAVKSKPRKPREPDPIFDVCQELTYGLGAELTKEMATRVGRLRKIFVGLKATPDDIRNRFRAALRRFENKAGIDAVHKNWAQLGEDIRRLDDLDELRD